MSYFRLINCPICSSKQFKILYLSTLQPEDFAYKKLIANVKNTLDDYTKHAQIVKCRNCKLIYVNPVEDLSLILQAYRDVVDDEYLRVEKYRKILHNKHLQRVSKYIRKGKMLDVGSFAGYFLELAKNDGWKIYGIEPSSWASTIAKEKGVTNIGRDIFSAKIKNDYFDMITMWDVIEHLPEPHKVFSILNKSLKKGGVLAIGTPDIESIFARILGKNCPFLIRMHIILYSPRTLQLLFAQHGFKIVDISYYGRTFSISYLLNRLPSKNKTTKNIIGYIQRMPFLPNLPITLNFRDSVRIIAQKL